MEANEPISEQAPPDERLTDPILAEPDPVTDAFLARAYWRMQTTIAVLGILGSAVIAATLGWRNGAGFFLGAALAYLNFRWLKQSILALTDGISAQETSPQGRAVVFKFIFRYLVVATVGYAIISSSTINVLSVIAGFFLSVAALLLEAVTEVVYGLRHGD